MSDALGIESKPFASKKLGYGGFSLGYTESISERKRKRAMSRDIAQ